MKTDGNKAYLSVQNRIGDASVIEISCTIFSGDSYHLKDKIGNLVNNFKIGVKNADISLIGTSF
ncbi:hypothetical protein [Candidatus Ruthturnera calyptogenae]|uniref:hypothetical protein n=1 Tax=Candidatus Ruthturnera calyptogenae TaxID=386487 RepID=UPI0003105A9B|nr:hypothetical protein [Candidatus Ruthturnera calyptogenae]